MKKTIYILLGVLIGGLLRITPISANAFNQDSLTGELTVALKSQENEALVNAKVQIYQIAKISDTGVIFKYELLEELIPSGVSSSQLQNIQSAKILAEYIRKQNLSLIWKETDESGTVTFEGLDLGIYLVLQGDQSGENNTNEIFNPYLVSIPVMNTDAHEWEYQVITYPKIQLEQSSSDYNSEASDSKLPQTGVIKWPIPILSVAGMGLYTIGWITSNKEKGYKNER